MFDKTYIHDGPSSIRATITERRAPTDESVRLLSEMQEKVLASVVESFVFGDNEVVRGRVSVLRNSMTIDGVIVVCSFRINGVDCQVREMAHSIDFFMDRTKAARTLARAVADKIFEALVVPELGKALAPAMEGGRW